MPHQRVPRTYTAEPVGFNLIDQVVSLLPFLSDLGKRSKPKRSFAKPSSAKVHNAATTEQGRRTRESMQRYDRGLRDYRPKGNQYTQSPVIDPRRQAANASEVIVGQTVALAA